MSSELVGYFLPSVTVRVREGGIAVHIDWSGSQGDVYLGDRRHEDEAIAAMFSELVDEAIAGGHLPSGDIFIPLPKEGS